MEDIYDSVFRTLLNDCPYLILPVINEAFGENYKGNERIEFFPNEHFIAQQNEEDKKRITDSNFVVYGKSGAKKYHWECQSTNDNKMIVRLFEYDAQIALDEGKTNAETLTVIFPHSAVLYLRSTKKTPETYSYKIVTPGGTVKYSLPILKVKSYSISKIFEKKLYFLIPFYIFTHESRLKGYEEDSEKLEKLKEEYTSILQQLEELVQQKKLGYIDSRLIIEYSSEVVKALSKKYTKVKENMEEIMGGFQFETETTKMIKKYRDEGRIEGRNEGRFEEHREMIMKSVKSVIKNLNLSLEQAFELLELSEDDKKEVSEIIKS